jgi:hypothetical protein
LKCAVCDRKSAGGNFCTFHQKAYENIFRGYDHWREALEISWKEYLSQIANNPLTGEWTKEVVRNMMKSEGQAIVKKG